jgi:multidrug efflux pump subunit AcrA (membrane-fusion protein)
MHFFKELKFLPEDFRSGGRGLRMLKVLGIPLLLIIIAGALPLPTTVERHSAVEISDPEQIRPEVPGFLPKVEFTEGTWIAPGTTLAKMENRELRLAAETAALQLRATEAAIQQARALNKPDELLQLEYILKARQAQLAEAEANIRKLELRAVKGGVLLTRDLGSRVGMLLRAGDTFCEIAPLDPIRISIPLSEKQVRTVRPGQRVELAADAFPGIRFQGTVTEEPSPLAKDRFPAAFSKQRGGDVPTIPGEHGAEYLAEHTYVVTVDIANPGNRLRHGMSIRARVETGTQPLWQTWANGVLDLISLDYRLMFP